jgi:hypothetical protein
MAAPWFSLQNDAMSFGFDSVPVVVLCVVVEPSGFVVVVVVVVDSLLE